jgi:hypothetical protein
MSVVISGVCGIFSGSGTPGPPGSSGVVPFVYTAGDDGPTPGTSIFNLPGIIGGSGLVQLNIQNIMYTVTTDFTVDYVTGIITMNSYVFADGDTIAGTYLEAP